MFCFRLGTKKIKKILFLVARPLFFAASRINAVKCPGSVRAILEIGLFFIHSLRDSRIYSLAQHCYDIYIFFSSNLFFCTKCRVLTLIVNLSIISLKTDNCFKWITGCYLFYGVLLHLGIVSLYLPHFVLILIEKGERNPILILEFSLTGMD